MKTIKIGAPVFAIPNDIPGWSSQVMNFGCEADWNPFFDWRHTLLDYTTGHDMWRPFRKTVVHTYLIGDRWVPWGPNPKDYIFVLLPHGADSEYIGFIVANEDIITK